MTQDLTTINRSPQARLAFCNQILEYKGGIEASFLELGRRLRLVREERLYSDQWESFDDYLMELKNISLPTATKLINIYGTFVVEYKIPVKKLVQAGGWTMLAETLPVVKSKEDALAWLEKATLLTRTDLRREIQEANTGILMRDCEHEESAYLRVCLRCGIKERINLLPKDLPLLKAHDHKTAKVVAHAKVSKKGKVTIKPVKPSKV